MHSPYHLHAPTTVKPSKDPKQHFAQDPERARNSPGVRSVDYSEVAAIHFMENQADVLCWAKSELVVFFYD